MRYRFAFSLAALERPTSGGAASYIAFLSFGRPGKLPRGVLLHVSPDIGCGYLEMPMTTLKSPMVVCRLGF